MGGKHLDVLELFHKGPPGRSTLPEAQSERGSARHVDAQHRIPQLAGEDRGALHPVGRRHEDTPGRSRRVRGQNLDGDLRGAGGGLDGVLGGFRHDKGEVPEGTALHGKRVVGDLGLEPSYDILPQHCCFLGARHVDHRFDDLV